MKHQRPTQRDIAKATNTSQTLVSLVLSNASVEVSDETRERIVAAAQKMGYIVKKKRKGDESRRQSDTSSRKRLLAYIRPLVTREHFTEEWICDSYRQYYNRIQDGLVENGFKNDYSIVVRPYRDVGELTEWLIEWGVDGVFWHARNDEFLRWISERYPVVQIQRRTLISADAVYSNQEECIQIALEHLRKLGHTKVAYWPTSAESDIGSHIYLAQARNLGMQVYDELLDPLGHAFAAGSTDYFFNWFRSNESDRPTAVIVGDHIGLRLIRCSLEEKISLPRELSIVGIDNISASAFSYPALTSIDNRTDEITRVAIQVMVERIKHPERAFQKLSITPELISRESVCDLSKIAEPAPFPMVKESRKETDRMNSDAFTLIELLGCVAIIAVLVALSVPFLQNAMVAARNAKCISNLHSIGAALGAYAGDNQGAIPAAVLGSDRTAQPKPPISLMGWPSRLVNLGYADNVNMFYCPEFTPRNSSEAARDIRVGGSTLDTYGMRVWAPANAINSDFLLWRYEEKKLAFIAKPDDFFLVADSYNTSLNTQFYTVYPGSTFDVIHLRHSKKANTLFADFHVEAKNAAYFANLYHASVQGAYGNGSFTHDGGVFHTKTGDEPLQ